MPTWNDQAIDKWIKACLRRKPDEIMPNMEARLCRAIEVPQEAARLGLIPAKVIKEMTRARICKYGQGRDHIEMRLYDMACKIEETETGWPAQEAPPLKGKAEKAANYIVQHPGRTGDVLSRIAGYSDPASFRRMFANTLAARGFENKRPGYFPPEK
jgi:hypothetical protein